MGEAVADVLIIGAGPAGAVAARTLAQAGHRVVCLEQGTWPDRNEFRGGELDWELTMRKRWHSDPNIRSLPEDYPVEIQSSTVSQVHNYNAVGGSATLYNGVWPRMTPANFASRTLRGYGQDWPLSYDELAGYYTRTDREVGVAGLEGNPLFPDDFTPPMPPLPIQPGGLLLARAAAHLGWRWWPEYNAILTREQGDRHACVQRGTCNQGCPEGAKGTPDLTHWPAVLSRGGAVVTGARVTRIVLDGNGLACGAEWTDASGREHFQRADVVICAANAIGTPRLLLASSCPRFPEGLANGSGLVGRNLMFHPHAMVTGFFDEDLHSWQGQMGAWIGIWEFYESDASRGFVGTCKLQVQGTGGPLGHTLPAPGFGTWGPDHHSRLAERLGRTVNVIAVGEELASVDNRVTLSGDLTDAAGLAAPKITYEVSANSREMMAFHVDRMTELLVAAGATRTEPHSLLPVSAHFMGTARMGDSPDSSVVDRFGIAHEIPNLAIVDGSVFVTSGGVNPTSTISALAARTADHLIELGSRIPRPSHAQARPPAAARAAAAADEGSEQETPQDTPQDTPQIPDPARRRLEYAADGLIPAHGRHPAASTVGIGNELLDAVLRARPDLAAPLARAVSHDFADPLSDLEALRRQDPEAAAALELAVAGGYYMSSEVRKAIDYPGQVPVIVRPDPHPAYVEEGLLDHILNV